MKKSRFHKLSTDETTEKTRKCYTGTDKKATNFGLKLLNGTSKFPYRFKEIISLILPYIELINKAYIKIFQNGLQVLVGVSFQNHQQIFCMFEELLHLLTLSQVHNGL